MEINEIIKNEERMKETIKKYHEKWEERERIKEKVSMNTAEHMNYLVSCIKNSEYTDHRAIDMDMLIYSSNEDYNKFADIYSYLFDALIAYARKNMLTFKNGDYECWFVLKHEDSFYEFNELHGQGSHISTRLLDDYEGPHFTLKQFSSGYQFDTAEAERLKMDMEFRNFLHERKQDGISEKIILEVLEKYSKDKKK